MSDGQKREKPSEAFSAEVAITSLTIATERKIHCCMGGYLLWLGSNAAPRSSPAAFKAAFRRLALWVDIDLKIPT
jgi:hypothetical protein